MPRLNSEKKWSIITPLILFLTTFSLYLHNLSPSVYGGDVGDFLTAIAVKGVPHPSGYPLFTILGILTSYLPINQTLAWKVGLISAISSSFSVVLIYLISKLLAKNILISAMTALTLAFYYVFWLYAEIAEVFALNNFFILLLLYLSILYFFKKNTFLLYLLSFFAGLSLSNHEVISLIFPSVLILILKANWKILLKPKVILKCLLLFLLGLLPYLYIPLVIHLNKNLPFNWNGITSENILQWILRSDYGWKPAKTQDYYLYFLSLKTYLISLLIGLTPAGFLIAILGMISVIRKKNIFLFLSFFLAFTLTGPLAVSYVNTPIFSGFTFGVLERFYMISAIILLIFFPFGIIFITENILKVLIFLPLSSQKKSFYLNIFSLIFMIIPLFFFIGNYPKTDLHHVWIGDYLAQDVLLSLPKDSALFLSGDTMLFNTLYAQYALGIRKDVTVINLGTIEKDKNFRQKRDELSNQKNIAKDSLETYAISSLLKERNSFSNVAIGYKDKKYEKPIWIPYGLILKFAKDSDKNISEDIFLNQQVKILNKTHLPKNEKKLSERSLTLSQIPIIYAQAYVNTASFLVSKYDDGEKAKEYYQKAVGFAPEEVGGYIGLGYYYLNKNDCRNAEESFNRVISLNPGNKNGHIMLYATYDSCFKDVRKVKKIENQFFSTFKTPILKEIKKELNKQ